MKLEIQKLNYQSDDNSELSTLVRRCIMLSKQSKWQEVINLSGELLRQFPENLSLVELFVSATVSIRDWQSLTNYYSKNPEIRAATPRLAIAMFDFHALNGNYDELIVHVWECVFSGANEELLKYFESALEELFVTDPSFCFSISNLSGDPKLSPLDRIIDSFSDLLRSGRGNHPAASSLGFFETLKGVSPSRQEFQRDIEWPDELILEPQKLINHVLNNRKIEVLNVSKPIDVIIPIYRGYEETMRCIASVLLNPQSRSFEIIVINDCTPDARIALALDMMSNSGLINLHKNKSNMGFVRSCNYAALLHPDRDIILLNSDTEVYGDWIDRILNHAENELSAGTITPFSNNATICSYPHFAKDNHVPNGLVGGATLDKFASYFNDGPNLIEIPTGVGFCMYVRRACIQELGLFNYEVFGEGYGEENDLCRRIIGAGYKNYLAPNIYVYHAGATSFGVSSDARKEAALAALSVMHPSYEKVISNHIELDPARHFRARIDIERLRWKIALSTGAILHVTHALGGGTAKHVAELCNFTVAEGRICLIARPLDDKSGRFAISCFDDDSLVNLPSFSCFEAADDLFSFLSYVGVNQVHIHHLLGYGHLAPQYFQEISSLIVTDFTAHDYFSICARITLTDGTGKYCGEPSIAKCQACITNCGSYIPAYVTADSWRKSNMKLLAGVRHIFAPSKDCADRISKYTVNDAILLRPHPLVSVAEPNSSAAKHIIRHLDSTVKFRRIAILGNINDIKGARVIIAVANAAKQLNLPITFHIIGDITCVEQFSNLENLFVSGSYEPDELQGLISLTNADFMWIPSIWPETFCYALLEGISAGMMPVTFDIGAQAERIRDLGWGAIVPLSFQNKPRELAMFLSSVVVNNTIKLTLDDFSFKGFDCYYGLSK